MVQVDITFLRRRTRSNFQDGQRRTLVIGQWKTNQTTADDPKRVSIDCDPMTPTKAKISVQENCDSTPSTVPTSIGSTKIEFDFKGRPKHIEVYHISDDCSVSTMGDSVFDDATPSSSSAVIVKPSTSICGTF
jgi:hypothetical protein